MRKIIIVCLLVLMGCGGGGGSDIPAASLTQEQEDAIIDAGNSYLDKLESWQDQIDAVKPPTPDTYASFLASDFSGKTLYHVSLNSYMKVEYAANGYLKAYFPNQETEYEIGSWTLHTGKLLVITASTIDTYALSTLLSDDEANRYFKTSQRWEDGTVKTIGIFYDQTTGREQAQAFVNERRIP